MRERLPWARYGTEARPELMVHRGAFLLISACLHNQTRHRRHEFPHVSKEVEVQVSSVRNLNYHRCLSLTCQESL